MWNSICNQVNLIFDHINKGIVDIWQVKLHLDGTASILKPRGDQIGIWNIFPLTQCDVGNKREKEKQNLHKIKQNKNKNKPP